MEMAESKLTIEIQNKDAVELGDLANSFSALGREFEKHAMKLPDYHYPIQAKLYVNELRKGSIIADLFVVGSSALVAASAANSVLDFAQHIKNLIDFFTKPKLERDVSGVSVDKDNCDNVTKLLNIVAKDNGSNMNIIAQDGAAVNIMTINVSSGEAQKIIAHASLERNRIEQPVTNIHEKVVLYWYQARNELKNKTGDKGKIESISRFPVKILFSNDEIKQEMLSGDENIFHWAYVVTVAVETVEERPVAYKIIELHDKFQL